MHHICFVAFPMSSELSPSPQQRPPCTPSQEPCTSSRAYCYLSLLQAFPSPAAPFPLCTAYPTCVHARIILTSPRKLCHCTDPPVFSPSMLSSCPLMPCNSQDKQQLYSSFITRRPPILHVAFLPLSLCLIRKAQQVSLPSGGSTGGGGLGGLTPPPPWGAK